MSQTQTHSYDTKPSTSFKDGVSKVSAGFDTAKDDLSTLASDAAGAAKSGLAEAGKAVKRTVDSSRQTAAQAVDDVAVRISENPLTSVVIAAGVGMIAGYFMNRSRG